jgi:hypothetical protein
MKKNPLKNENKEAAVRHPEDADWAAFERAVDAAVKGGPLHKTNLKPKERPASKGRVHKGKTHD